MTKAIVFVAAVLLLALAAIFFVLWRSVPPLAGRERVPGLGDSVTVVFDSLAIPHITAASDTDAFFALGWLHARERMFSMDLMRRAAEGRLSEVLGASTWHADAYLRTLDIPYAAERSLALVAPGTRPILDAYVRGVNAWIARPGRPLPPEFVVLRYHPEPWTARQVFELARLMSNDLRSGANELDWARALNQVGAERLKHLLPPADTSTPIVTALRGAALPRAPELAERLLDLSSISRASNSWVIGGARTASGKPIVANDPHLGLRAPSLWYLAVLNSPSYHAGGTTIPGVPGVILGHNRRIAWGWTNGSVDDADWVIERLNADSSQVLTADGWRPTEKIRDSIRVRGRAAVPFTLVRTSHGPIGDAYPVSADNIVGEHRLVAFKWVGHDASDDLSAILALDRAQNWNDFLAAARGLHSPEQNWIYGDVDGNIGYTLAGAVPVRHSGNGLLPTPGWTDEGRWEGYVPFDELPRIYNPRDGFIVTANNRIAGASYRHFITADWELPYRAQRIREMILAGSRLTAHDVQRMQMDTLDVFARWAKGIAARAADDIGRTGLGDTLRAWDGTMGSDRVEPTVFWWWYDALRREGQVHRAAPMIATAAFHAALHADTSWLFDDPRTPARETLRDAAAAAMREVFRQPRSRWRWGDYHVTESVHPLGSVTVLDALLRLNLGPAPRAGSGYTVNVGGGGWGTPGFVRHNVHAASFRQVVDLAQPDVANVITTTGQSGNPLSRHYRDQRASWWSGNLAPVSLSGSRGTTLVLLK